VNEIVLAVIVLGGTGLLMGLFLAFASKKFEVAVDPKVEKVLEVLPGINCGACGYPGCSGYADAIALKGAPITSCSPGGPNVAQKIAAIMGMAANISKEKIVARVLCQGDNTKTTKKYEFDGNLVSCNTVALYGGGEKSCSYACLGLGDCIKVCPANAISITEKGIAVIDEDKCISCQKCVKTCPKNVITMIPESKEVTVLCSSKDKGAIARQNCSVACIGCGMCVRICPVDAIIIKDNLAQIDSKKCMECYQCYLKCPTKAIGSKVKNLNLR
jgi:electron transport complex protein RnfB